MRGSGDYIPREAAREAVWQILNGMGYSEKHNDRLVEEVDAVFDDIPAADVRPVVNTCETCGYKTDQIRVKPYDGACCYWKLHSIKNEEWCCHWKQREES